MGTKKNFVLRVNQDDYDALERWAADEFRSVNGQIEYILHQALKGSKRDRESNSIPGGTKNPPLPNSKTED